MTQSARSVCLINGSLRGRKAASLAFLHDVTRRLSATGCRTSIVTVRASLAEGYPQSTLEHIGAADALVLVFPLYNYGLPGALMRLLEDYNRFVCAGGSHVKGARVYVVVNCAYPRPELTTTEAIRVIRNFCRRLSLQWRFAVCIGTGPVVVHTKKIPLLDLRLKQAFAAIGADIGADAEELRADYFIHPVIPEGIIRRIKEHYEKKGGMIAPREVP